MSDRAPGLVLGENVQIGEGVTFGAHVVVHDGTVIGDGCLIEDHAVLGKRPRLARGSSAQGEVGVLEIGARVTICSGAVVFAGASGGRRSDTRRPVLCARAHANRSKAR